MTEDRWENTVWDTDIYLDDIDKLDEKKHKCGSAKSCEYGDMCKPKYDIGGCSHFKQKKPPAHWIEENTRPKSFKWICSECGSTVYDMPMCNKKNYKKMCLYQYCPYCGVRMDLSEVAE